MNMDMNMDEISRNVQNNKQSICARVCTMRKRILFQKQTNKQQQQQQQNKTRKKKQTNKPDDGVLVEGAGDVGVTT